MSFSSFKNLTGTKLSSLKKGSSYLSNYLSPNAATSKKTQDALLSIKSAYANAATVVSKRVEEIREAGLVSTTPGMSPAPSSQYLSTPDGRKDEDAVSNSSGDSRRPSAIDGYYVNDQSETWSAFTGQLWDQFWGTDGSAYRGNNQNRPAPRVSDISEQYERLYSELPKCPPGPVAMELQMTSCSICRYCKGILFDEHIMAGWTAEDSNLNTRCPFCDRMVVPFLTIRVIDFRTRPRGRSSHNSKEENEKEKPKENGGDKAKEEEEVPESADDEKKEEERIKIPPPIIFDHITVPYLSPLVLRKELENMLETEGDNVLLDSQGVDSHPIIFWNLIWFFERIAVKSHLPGLCLNTKSLNSGLTSLDTSWKEADHRNIYIQCRWDNERLHETREPPLYTLWQKHHSEGVDAKQLVVMVEKQNPEYRGLMQQIINAVQVNDLVQVIGNYKVNLNV